MVPDRWDAVAIVANSTLCARTPGGEKIEVIAAARVETANVGYHLAEQEQPDCRLQGAGEDLARIVLELANLCVCDGIDLRGIAGGEFGVGQSRMALDAEVGPSDIAI